MILVTGGAGFIGSHIVDALVRAGERVRVLDDLSTGHRENLKEVAGKVEFIEASITDAAAVGRAMRGVERVYHEAACPFVTRSIDEPLPVHEANATGTLTVLDRAAAAGVKRLVFASSCSVYGDEVGEAPGHEGLREAPQSPYAAQKLMGEHYARIFSRTTPLQCVSLRYYNVFGPRQDSSSAYSGVISIFCDRLLQGVAPVIYGDGHQTRDFVHVSNVVRANLLAGTADVPGGAVFNIASGRSVSLLELHAALARHLDVTLAPRHEPARVGDIRHSAASIRRAEKELGYRCEIDYETGLRDTLEWFRSRQTADT